MKTYEQTRGVVGLLSLVTVLLGAQVAVAAFSTAPPAPDIRAAIDGMVAKPTGDAIAGAQVALLDGAGQVLDRTRTGKNGRFHFDHVRRGKYWIYTQFGQLENKRVIALEGAGGVRITVVLE